MKKTWKKPKVTNIFQFLEISACCWTVQPSQLRYYHIYNQIKHPWLSVPCVYVKQSVKKRVSRFSTFRSASCKMGTGSFPRVKSDRGVTLTFHPLLVPLFMKEQSYSSTPPLGRTACTEPQCLYKGALYLYIFYLTFSSQNIIL